MGQPQRRQPGTAGHPDLIPHLRTRTAQGLIRLDFAQRSHTQIERTGRGIAANQFDSMRLGAGKKAAGKSRQPSFIGGG